MVPVVTGYIFMMGGCIACHKPFVFNPNKVPAIKDAQGVKQPICEPCHTFFNEERKKLGIEPWPDPLPGAYEAADENTIDWG